MIYRVEFDSSIGFVTWKEIDDMGVLVKLTKRTPNEARAFANTSMEGSRPALTPEQINFLADAAQSKAEATERCSDAAKLRAYYLTLSPVDRINFHFRRELTKLYTQS